MGSLAISQIVDGRRPGLGSHDLRARRGGISRRHRGQNRATR